MRRQEPGIIVHGPFAGLNESVDPKLIGDRELAAASNVVLRGGRVTPRPGYATARTATFGTVVTTLLSNATYTANSWGPSCDNDGSFIYFGLYDGAVPANNRLFRRSFDGTALETVLSGATVDKIERIRINWINANNIDVYFWRATVGAYGIYKTNYDGAIWGAAALIYAPPNPPSGIPSFDLDRVNQHIWLVGNDADGHLNIYRTDLAGGNLLSWYDAGAVGLIYDLRYYNNYLYFSYGAATWRSLTGAYNPISLGAGTANMQIAVDQTNSKLLLWVWQSSTSRIWRCNFDGSSLELFCTDPRFGPNTYGGDWMDTGYLALINNADDTMYGIMTNVATQSIVSSAWIERSRLGVGSDFSRDIMLSQILSSGILPSGDPSNTSRLAAWFPTSDDLYHLLNGYRYFSGTTRHSLVMNSRDTLPGDGTALSAKSGRMAFAWQGQGISTASGGMICADGDEDSDSPYCFNYVLGDSIWDVWTTGGAGTFTITFVGETTIPIAWNDPASTVRTRFQALDAVDAVVVSGTGTAADPYRIRLYGAWSGQNTPALTATGAGGATAYVSQFQVGGTDTDSWLYLRPCGLPTPIRRTPYTGAPATAEVGFEIRRHLSGGGLISGIYSYVITFYSSRWNIESPPNAVMGLNNAGTDTAYIELIAGTHRAELYNWTLPTTLYFNKTDSTPAIPFRHIDRVRIYRRRWGAQFSGSVPDGVSAQTTWRLVTEIDISIAAAGQAFWYDTVSDAGIETNTPVPYENGYPPRNANFVTMHQGKAYYAGQTAGDHNIWISEIPKKGGASNGELGYEYVADWSYQTLAQFLPSDASFTALFGDFGPNLIIGTPEQTLRGYLAQQMFGTEILTVEPIMAAPGIASHWMIARGQELPDSPPVLFWVAPSGHVYQFDGQQAMRLTAGFSPTGYLSAYARRYWNIDTSFDAGFDNSWYYGNLIVDPQRQLLIAQGWQSGVGACIVLALDGPRGWTTWALNGHGWVLGRDSTTGAARAYFGIADCKLAYLSDGAADSGTSFAWSYRTKAFNAENLLMKKRWREFVLMFSRRNFGAASAAIVTLQPYLNGYQVAALKTTTTLTEDTTPPTDDIAQASAMVGQLAKHLQLEVSGTQVASRSHPELAGLFVEFVPEEMARER